MVNVLWYAGTICAYLIPFFIVWVITRRFEREVKRIISSTYFLIAFAFILAYIFAITYFEFTTWEIHYLFHLLVNLPLVAGTFFMYFFLLKLREEIGAEKATSRLLQSVFPIIFLSIFFIGIFGAIGTESTRLTGSFSGSMNPFFGLHLLSYPIGVIFAFLSYLEMAYLLKTFKVKLRHLVYFAAFLLLGTPTLWMFDLVCYWLMLAGTPYAAVETAPALVAGIITLFASLPIWIELKREVPSVEKLKPRTTYERGIVKLVGQIGDVIGSSAVKMLLFYVRAYNKLYEKEVKVDESLKFEGLKGGEEKDLAKFITLSFKNDLGPSVLRYAKSLDEFKDIVGEIEVKMPFLK